MSAGSLPVLSGSLPVSSPATPVPIGNFKRRTADFGPSKWGDQFLKHAHDSNMMNHDNMEQQIQNLKVEVKRMLVAADDSHMAIEQLNLVDQIQRLGIAYHFEREIDECLEKIHKLYFESNAISDYSIEDHDLYTTGLMFRLLRQQGYRVSCDIFHKFKNTSTGKFKETLVSDTKGLLSLYEASQLRVRDEEVLEDALVFTLSHLNRCIQESKNGDRHSPAMAARVRRALKHCLRKGLTRVEARHYISIYESDDSHNEELLALAKLDFNLLQEQHREELKDISRWWKELDFVRKLPFCRDRVVECYIWAMGTHFEPHYSLSRNIFAKVLTLTSVMDDIYDAYGAPEELDLLTGAIERWESRETCQLPDYMQVYYNALLGVFDEIEEKLADVEGKSFRLFYGKKAMGIQARSYCDEAKWMYAPGIPTLEEYLSVAAVSATYFMNLAMSLLGTVEIATEHTFEWALSSRTKIVWASSVIGRIANDIASHKFEQERGHAPSAVECYMKQHGVSEQQAKEKLHKEIEGAWMDINEGCLGPYEVPEPLLAWVVNLARLTDTFYAEANDRYTRPDRKIQQIVASLLVDPIPWWESRETCQLPDYMQLYYNALLGVFDEIEEKLADVEGKSYRLLYGRKAMGIQARSYCDEAKWMYAPGIPTLEEYLSVAAVSATYFMDLVMSLLGMGEIANEHAFEWTLNIRTKIVWASSVIGRLTNDIASHKFEQKRGHAPSAVECYMKQHCVSEHQAKDKLRKEIDGAWMDINEEFLSPHEVPVPLLTCALNLARLSDTFYGAANDRYTRPDLEIRQIVASLLIDPIPS